MLAEQYPEVVEYDTYYSDNLQKLQEMGWICYKDYSSGGNTITITDKGEEQGLTVIVNASGFGVIRHAVNGKVGEKKFIEVTGIKMERENLATMEFMWKYDNLTPFHDVVIEDKLNPSEIHTKSRSFVLYDNGWRIGE